jgi:6-phosphogluconolactonase
VYIGTYTNGTSKGILHARFDTRTGHLSGPELAIESPNPTFLAVHPAKPLLYAINEIGTWKGEPTGSVGAYSIDAPGKLTRLNEVSSKGRGPCHIVLDTRGRAAVVANYGSGSVASYHIGADGKLSDAVSFFQYQGYGPNKARQEGPHAHCAAISPDNRHVVTCDLGTDLLHIYDFDPRTGTLTPHKTPTLHVLPGSGPRHIVIDPDAPYAFCVNELASTLTSYAWDRYGGELKEIDTQSMLPAGFSGRSTAAEIMVHAPSGRIFASNRGDDSIVIFSLAHGGKLTLVDRVPVGGQTPRHFNFDPTGRWVLVANQGSNNITIFEVSKKGALRATGGQVAWGAPVCVCFAG